MNWKKIALSAFLIILLVVGRTLYYAGAFKNALTIGRPETKHISGMIGAEDITIDQLTGFAFVSSDDRRSTVAGKPKKGAIYLLNLSEEDPKPLELTSDVELDDFHPHGISFFHDNTDNTRWLFVINHRAKENTVEVFQFKDTALIHVTSVSDTHFVSPNDLVAVSKNAFYFTNDHDSHGGVSSWKDFLVIGTGQLCFYDGQKTSILEKGIRYANGITLSPDGSKIYVAACTDGSILSYNREPFSATGKIKCNTGVDNLEWDSDGNLWVGAHTKMLAFLGHAKDANKRSPSEVLKISFPKDQKEVVTQVYLNDGNPLSGSSVAAPYKGKIYLGAVFDDGVLVLQP
ncbi:MAG: SMP-30/gluconolactonase/LRE family protein [Bacteroidota bacterium]